MVLVRRDEAKPPLSPAYAGPYEVLERSPSYFKLQIGGKADIVATARLKAAELPPDALLAALRRRGRPPRGSGAAPVPASSLPTSTLTAPRRRRVAFLLPPTVPAAPSGRPVRLRRPLDRLSLSAISFKTGGEV
jgi:hypothetical protein